MLTLVLGLAWAAWSVAPPARGSAARHWESATAAECGLLAQALQATTRRGAPALPLIWDGARGPACLPALAAISSGQLTQDAFARAAANPDSITNYLPHVGLSAVSYSPLGFRAAVIVWRNFGWESGYGETCYFRRSLSGWRLQGCRQTSIT